MLVFQIDFPTEMLRPGIDAEARDKNLRWSWDALPVKSLSLSGSTCDEPLMSGTFWEALRISIQTKMIVYARGNKGTS